MVDLETKGPIFLCEPQCVGFEHVPVNAGLLEVMHQAFPDRELVFAAEKTHGQGVRKMCKQGTATFRLLEILPPSRNLTHIKRYFPEKKLFTHVVALAEQQGCNAIIFTSLTDTCYYLQGKFLKQGGRLRFVNFLHGMLQSMLEAVPWKPWKKCFWFPSLLQRAGDEEIYFFVYGKSIYDAALSLMPHVAGHLFFLDHPCFFHPPSPGGKKKPLRIASLGIGGRSKGTHLFFDLARQCRKEIEAGLLEFMSIGPILDRKLNQIPGYVHCPSPHTHLERERYEELVGSIDYALLLYDQEAYRLTASGAFMDAVSFAKPVIALHNPFFQRYFSALGDIGFLCSTVDEILSILRKLPHETTGCYLEQVKNMVQGREVFSFQALGSALGRTFQKLV